MVRVLTSHQCGPGSSPCVDAICGLSLLLVLSLAPRRFSAGTPVFSSPQKPTFPNSNLTRNQVDEEPLCGCATSKSLFIYYYSFIIYLLFIITLLFLPPKSEQLTFKCCLARYCTCSGFYRLLVSWPSFKNCPRTKKNIAGCVNCYL